MTAVAADIVAAGRVARIVKREDASIKSSYPGARDNLESPSTGYFDSQSDAMAALNIEGTLTGVARRRFSARVQEMDILDPATDGVPTYHLIDAEQQVDTPCLVSRVVVDLENEATDLELFG
jgi:hypothetical protein